VRGPIVEVGWARKALGLVAAGLRRLRSGRGARRRIEAGPDPIAAVPERCMAPRRQHRGGRWRRIALSGLLAANKGRSELTAIVLLGALRAGWRRSRARTLAAWRNELLGSHPFAVGLSTGAGCGAHFL